MGRRRKLIRKKTAGMDLIILLISLPFVLAWHILEAAFNLVFNRRRSGDGDSESPRQGRLIDGKLIFVVLLGIGLIVAFKIKVAEYDQEHLASDPGPSRPVARPTRPIPPTPAPAAAPTKKAARKPKATPAADSAVPGTPMDAALPSGLDVATPTQTPKPAAVPTLPLTLVRPTSTPKASANESSSCGPGRHWVSSYTTKRGKFVSGHCANNPSR